MAMWLRRFSAILLCGLLMQGCGKDSTPPQPPAPLPYAWIAIDTSASMAGFFRPTQKGATPGYPTIQRLMASDELINLLNHPEPLTPFVSEVGLTVSDGSQVHSLANWSRGSYEHLVKDIYRQIDSRFPDLFAPKKWKDLEKYQIVMLITDLVVDFSRPAQGAIKPAAAAAEDKKAGKRVGVEQACNMGNDVGCLAGRLVDYLRAHPKAGLWIIGMRDNFKGDYYPVGGGRFSYSGRRPIYIVILASNLELGWSVTSRIGQKAVEIGREGADEWLKAVAFSPPPYEFRLARSEGQTSLRLDKNKGGWRCTGEGKGALDLLPVSGSGSFKIEMPLPIRVQVDKWGTIEDKHDNTKRLILDCGSIYPGKQTLKLDSNFLPPPQTIEEENRKWWFQWHTGVETQETADKTKNLYYLVKTLAEKIYDLRRGSPQELTLWK